MKEGELHDFPVPVEAQPSDWLISFGVNLQKDNRIIQVDFLFDDNSPLGNLSQTVNAYWLTVKDNIFRVHAFSDASTELEAGHDFRKLTRGILKLLDLDLSAIVDSEVKPGESMNESEAEWLKYIEAPDTASVTSLKPKA